MGPTIGYQRQHYAIRSVNKADDLSPQALRQGGMKMTRHTTRLTSLKTAIEHGKAGHADVATKHAKNAVTHLSQIK